MEKIMTPNLTVRSADHGEAEVSSSESFSKSTMTVRSDQDIAVIAYHLWELRGCPQGSPDTDWYLAEELRMQGEVFPALKKRTASA